MLFEVNTWFFNSVKLMSIHVMLSSEKSNTSYYKWSKFETLF